MDKVKVEQMQNEKGRSVENHFIITTKEGKYFQSYSSIIAYMKYATHTYKDNEPITTPAKIILDETYWNYSRTTSKYRSLFLGESRIETQKKIDDGEYILTNLN